MNTFQHSFITLLRYGLSHEESCPELPEAPLYSVVKRIADSQQVTNLIYYGACKTQSFLNDPAMMDFFNFSCRYISISENQMSDFADVSARFEQDGIDYAPVKGLVVKPLYPEPDMRLMGDCDILVRASQFDKIKAAMLDMGFTYESDESHEYSFISPNGVEFELHHELVPEFEKDLYTYFGDGWRFQKPVEGYAHRYEMSREDAFIFSFGHFVKHYRLHGAGMKYVLDFRQYLVNYPDLDVSYIRSELARLNLDTFFDNILRVIDVWFNDAPSDEVTDFLTDKLFFESVFGNDTNGSLSQALREEENSRIRSGKEKSGQIDASRARRRRWLHNIFLPYVDMCQKYPVLKKWAVLLPIFWVVRIFDILFFHRDKIKENKQSLDTIMSQEKLDQYRDELNMVGLSYNYEEFETEWKHMMEEKEKAEVS